MYYDCPCRNCWSPIRRCRDCITQAEAEVNRARERFITDCGKLQKANIDMERMVPAEIELIAKTVRRGQKHLVRTLEKLAENARHLSVPLQIPGGVYSSYPDVARQIREIVGTYEKKIQEANADVSSSEDMFRSHIVKYNALVNQMPSNRRQELGVKIRDPDKEVRELAGQMALTKPPVAVLTDQTAKAILILDHSRSSQQHRLPREERENPS